MAEPLTAAAAIAYGKLQFMLESTQTQQEKAFRPIIINGLYPAVERGLSADVLAARAMNGVPYPVCTAILSASHGTVTDVIDVPADSVDAQLEHVFKVGQPNAARIGIVGNSATVPLLFGRLQKSLTGPLLLDITLSGPGNEDLGSEKHTAALFDHLGVPDLVSVRRVDAELLCKMEINTLDDAQVAVQRLSSRGARSVLLRCGLLPSLAAGGDGESSFMTDLYYDGSDFGLFEAPHQPAPNVHGTSSAFGLALVRRMADGADTVAAIQFAKRFVTESLRHISDAISEVPHYFWSAGKYELPR